MENLFFYFMEIKLSKKFKQKFFHSFLENVASKNGCTNILMIRQFYLSILCGFWKTMQNILKIL